MNNEQIPNNENMNGGIPNPVPPAPVNPVDTGMGTTITPSPQPINMGMEPPPMATVPPVQTGVAGPEIPVAPPVQPDMSVPASPVDPPVPGEFQPDMGVAPQPVEPAVPNAGVNLNPVGVVESPAEVAASEPNVSPLMSTPLTADTNLNPTDPVVAPPTQPGVPNGMPEAPGMVPPGGNDGLGVPSPNIGIPTPPQASKKEEPEKKTMNKSAILVIVIVLILAVGIGVWFVLFGSKSKTDGIDIDPIVKNLELGGSIDTTSASSFANISGIAPSECTVNTNVNLKEARTYEYTITCGNVTSGPHEVVVSDTLPPVVVLKDLVVVPNTSLSAKDFIETIEDVSIEEDGSYVRFVQEVDTSVEGTFQVDLEFTDLYGNSTTETATYVVTENAPEFYYTCESEGEAGEELKYRFGISNDSYIYDAVKIVTFTYSDEASYNEAVETYNSTNSINGLTGKASFDEANLKISLKVNLTIESLPDEFATDVFEEEMDIQNVFGDRCETY